MAAPADPHDQRDAPRLEILGDLHGEVMVLQPMTVRQISRAGLQIETGFPLQVNSLHELRVTLGSRSIVVRGRVAHCSISDVEQEQITYRAGLEFIEPSDQVEEEIASFVRVTRETRGAR